MTLRAKGLILARVILLASVVMVSDASADVVSIAQSSFPPGATLINFDGLADGTEVNGLTVGAASGGGGVGTLVYDTNNAEETSVAVAGGLGGGA